MSLWVPAGQGAGIRRESVTEEHVDVQSGLRVICSAPGCSNTLTGQQRRWCCPACAQRGFDASPKGMALRKVYRKRHRDSPKGREMLAEHRRRKTRAAREARELRKPLGFSKLLRRASDDELHAALSKLEGEVEHRMRIALREVHRDPV